MASNGPPLPPIKRKHEATLLFTTDPSKLKVDEILDSSWCFKQQLQLEEGVSISFKCGDSVSQVYIIHLRFLKKHRFYRLVISYILIYK
jgi:hypothetical protein